jgi:SAM-dependent methyltransferase
VKKLSDRDLVAREYATVERLAMRGLDRTAWLGGEHEPWMIALAAIAEVRPARVLDAGCGSGGFAALLTAPDVRCVDLSPAAVDAALERGLRAEAADIQNLPFPDGSFDVAVANWVLYHIHDRALAIAELARVLTPAGRFVGCYNARDHLKELWSRVGVPSQLTTSTLTTVLRSCNGRSTGSRSGRRAARFSGRHVSGCRRTSTPTWRCMGLSPHRPARTPSGRPGGTSYWSRIDDPPSASPSFANLSETACW